MNCTSYYTCIMQCAQNFVLGHKLINQSNFLHHIIEVNLSHARSVTLAAGPSLVPLSQGAWGWGCAGPWPLPLTTFCHGDMQVSYTFSNVWILLPIHMNIIVQPVIHEYGQVSPLSGLNMQSQNSLSGTNMQSQNSLSGTNMQSQIHCLAQTCNHKIHLGCF